MNAWPIGSLSFTQTFFGSDLKSFNIRATGSCLLTVGIDRAASADLDEPRSRGHGATPLPAFAIIGGLMLFGHSHGVHPSADKIAIDHAHYGHHGRHGGFVQTAVRLVPLSVARSDRPTWELLWAGLIVLIGIQLLMYSE